MKVRMPQAIAGLMLSAAFAASAAEAANEACPTGKLTIVRISRIKPTGSMSGFEKAFSDHVKWYADHGLTQDKLVMAPVLVVDQASHSLIKSPDQVMTMHMESGSRKVSHDAAWDAYVAEYKQNSDIISETYACMP